MHCTQHHHMRRHGDHHGAHDKDHRIADPPEIRGERAESTGLATAGVDAVTCTLVLGTVEDQIVALGKKDGSRTTIGAPRMLAWSLSIEDGCH